MYTCSIKWTINSVTYGVNEYTAGSQAYSRHHPLPSRPRVDTGQASCINATRFQGVARDRLGWDGSFHHSPTPSPTPVTSIPTLALCLTRSWSPLRPSCINATPQLVQNIFRCCPLLGSQELPWQLTPYANRQRHKPLIQSLSKSHLHPWGSARTLRQRANTRLRFWGYADERSKVN